MHLQIVLLVCVLSVTVTVAHDPCEKPFYLYDNGDRNPRCPLTSRPTADCDLREGWYKVVSLTGPLRMTSHWTHGHGCGAKHPIWLNGSHPRMEEGVVSRQMCVGSHDSICDSTFEVEVKNCSKHFVYRLQKTSLHQRYCFDSGPECRPDNTTHNDQHHSIHYYPKTFSCLLFFAGFLIGSLVMLILATLFKRRQVKSASTRPVRSTPATAPPQNAHLPPSYSECVGSTVTNKY